MDSELGLKVAALIIEALTLAVAVGVSIFGLITYREYTRHRHAEWLHKLHAQFYESDKYKKIRRILDYQRNPDYENLENGIRGEEQFDESCESLVDYLNFFEFLATLRKLDSISQQELLMLFEEYLRMLSVDRNPIVWEFIKSEGYEKLKELILTMPPRA